jgi:hypothetical protein
MVWMVWLMVSARHTTIKVKDLRAVWGDESAPVILGDVYFMPSAASFQVERCDVKCFDSDGGEFRVRHAWALDTLPQGLPYTHRLDRELVDFDGTTVKVGVDAKCVDGGKKRVNRTLHFRPFTPRPFVCEPQGIALRDGKPPSAPRIWYAPRDSNPEPAD